MFGRPFIGDSSPDLAIRTGHAGTTYGKSSSRSCFETDGPSEPASSNLGVEARLDVWPRDRRIDVHDEHRAAVSRKDEQVVDIQLAVLARERRIEVMRHGESSA
jgi:hypothetical protein